MTTLHYEHVLELAQQLGPAEQLRLLEDLAHWVRQEIAPARHRRILELEGLGAEIWEGIDAQEYVRQERASWDG